MTTRPAPCLCPAKFYAGEPHAWYCPVTLSGEVERLTAHNAELQRDLARREQR